MCEPCKHGRPSREYKWCRCMSSCGSVEEKYKVYQKGKINGLHLIAELYDTPRLCNRVRNTILTEDIWVSRRSWILYPQFPYGDKESHTPFSSYEDVLKYDYENYALCVDPAKWGEFKHRGW